MAAKVVAVPDLVLLVPSMKAANLDPVFDVSGYVPT
eukprot:CAMPEP_0185689226 /NCGR_PEP_ID=MMETSP1164-20130828/338_1 /TAXON_ID=1104430 /ORGANISM="Chrysoreinhardia sp, Strain CCMP2950" /LENGTH=35 /DNA_ID= /DNA_START= /DNA_END= /DNA_ORIENTATION=